MSILAVHEVAEPRDEAGASLAVSAALHACVVGLFLLAPPAVPALSFDGALAAPVTARWLAGAVAESAGVAGTGVAGAGVERPGIEGDGSAGDGGAGGRVERADRERAGVDAGRRASTAPVSPTHAPADPLASLTALALALDSVAGPTFVAADALARVHADSVGLDGGGLDMIGAGRGAGGNARDTVDTPDATAFGLPGFGVSCSGPELDRRTALVGRVAAIESCSASNQFGAIGVGAFATREGATRRAPDEIEAGPQTARFGRCGCGEAEAHGALSREAVRRVVARHRAEIRGCYQAALPARPDLEGRVTASWQIAPSGAVSGAAIDAARSDLHQNEVETCIAHAVARWSFPSSDGPTVVSYPFVLGTE